MAGVLSLRRRVLAVFCGGFFGTITRYTLSLLITGWLGKDFPYDILLINLTGALILACVTALADATFMVGPTRRLFINIGFLGAYTTFSTLALGDVLLLSVGRWPLALFYLVLSLAGGMLAVLSGQWFGQALINVGRRSKKEERVPVIAPDPKTPETSRRTR